VVGEGAALEQLIPGNLLLLGVGRVDVVLGHIDLAGFEIAWRNGDRFGRVGDAATGKDCSEHEVVAAGLGGQVVTGECVPEFSVLG
jgi:hypothetical protein